MLKRLQHALIFILLLVSAYLLTVRGVIYWVQLMPHQWVPVFETLSHSTVKYTSLELEQSWLGVRVKTQDLYFKNESVDVSIGTLAFDVNFFSPFVFGLSIGNKLEIEDANIVLNVASSDAVNTAFDFSSLAPSSRHFRGLWKKVLLKNVTLDTGSSQQINVETLYLYKGSRWQLASRVSLTSGGVNLPAQVKVSLLPGLFTGDSSGSFSLNFLSPIHLDAIRPNLSEEWQAILPSGELDVSLEGEIKSLDRATIKMKMNAQKLFWGNGQRGLPRSLGLTFTMHPDLSQQGFDDFNWAMSLSKFRLDNEYVETVSPLYLAVNSAGFLNLSIESFSLAPFRSVLKHSLTQYFMLNQEIDFEDTRLSQLRATIDLKMASIRDFSVYLPKIVIPAIGGYPSALVEKALFEKKANHLSFKTDSPIVIQSHYLRAKPVRLKLQKGTALSLTLNEQDWTLNKSTLWVDDVSVVVGATGDRNGEVDLTGRFAFKTLASLKRLLPSPVMAQGVNTWLSKALVKGENLRGSLVLKGNLNNFPFDSTDGVFKVVLNAENVALKFDSKWPALKSKQLTLAFTPYDLLIKAKKARIQEVDLSDVTVSIDGLDKPNIALIIKGKADASVKKATRLMVESPLAEQIGIKNFLVNQMKGKGQLSVNLAKIWIPIVGYDSRSAEIDGSLLFKNNGITLFDTLSLNQVKGRLLFTEKTVSSKQLRGIFKDGLISANILTEKSGMKIAFKGLMDIEEPGFISGGIPWNGHVRFPKHSEDVLVKLDLDLKGVDSELPKPLASDFFRKNGASLTVDARVSNGAIETNSQLGGWGRLYARWDRELGEVSVLDAGVGHSVDNAIVEGFRVRGRLDSLEVDDWYATYVRIQKRGWLPEDENKIPNWLSSRLNVKHLSAFGNTFNDSDIVWGFYPEPQQLVLSVKNENTIDMSLTRKGGETYNLNINKLYLDSSSWNGGGSGICGATEKFILPDLRLFATDVILDHKKLDEIELIIVNKDEQVIINDFKVVVNSLKGVLTGDYRYDQASKKSQLDVHIQSADVSGLSRFLDVKKGFSGKSAELDMRGQWDGTLKCFAKKSVIGDIKITVKDGVIEGAEPGFARLLGLLSVDSLIKRLQLGVSELTAQGLAYNEIVSKGSLEGGVYKIDEFYLKAPAADVNLFGQVDLVKDLVDINVRITPEVGSSLPLIAALSGVATPLTGLAVYMLLKALPDVNEDLLTYRYKVDGLLSKPNIKNLGLGLELLETDK